MSIPGNTYPAGGKHMSVTLTGPNRGSMKFPLLTEDMEFVQRTVMAISQLDGVGNFRLDTENNVLHVVHSLTSYSGEALMRALTDLHDEVTEVMEGIREEVFA